MLQGLPEITEESLLLWLESSIAEKKNILGQGYHGAAYLYQGDGCKLVIKATHGSSGLRKFLLRQLKNEYEVYRRLEGINGLPKCHGMLQGQYLVLEYIEGVSLRTAELTDRVHFFASYLDIIKQVHQRGVAHGDMKRKENLLVVNGCEPYFIDFGVAIIRKDGFHPLNHFLFNFARQMDYNAWVKHKYRGDYSNITDEDRAYLRRTLIERLSRQLKRLLYPLIRSR